MDDTQVVKQERKDRKNLYGIVANDGQKLKIKKRLVSYETWSRAFYHYFTTG